MANTCWKERESHNLENFFSHAWTERNPQTSLPARHTHTHTPSRAWAADHESLRRNGLHQLFTTMFCERAFFPLWRESTGISFSMTRSLIEREQLEKYGTGGRRRILILRDRGSHVIHWAHYLLSHDRVRENVCILHLDNFHGRKPKYSNTCKLASELR